MPTASWGARSWLALQALTAACAVVAFAALAAGGYFPYGSLHAGERLWLRGAMALALLLALITAVVSWTQRHVLGRRTIAAGLVVAATAFSVPAVWALVAPTTTPLVESFGCGTVTNPQTLPAYLPAYSRACHDRLRRQELTVVGLATPAAAVLVCAAGLAVRRRDDE